MSVNISLADTPGVSAFFDGQPIQDELEAEIRREEERQEKELRDLLATELEDFEDDFLSDSNSEDDSVNVSHASRASSQRTRQNQEPKLFHQDVNKSDQVNLIPASVGQIHSSDSPQSAFFSPLVHRNQPLIKNAQGKLQQQQQQQNFYHQQQQADHLYHQEKEMNYAQNNFPAGLEHDHFVQGGKRSDSDLKAFLPYSEDNDEWMMRVQSQATAVSSGSPYHQPPHLQQYFSLPSQPNSGMIDNSPMPVTNHHHHLQPFHNPVTKSNPVQPPSMKYTTPTEPPPPPLPSTAPPVMVQNAIKESTDNYENYQVQYKTRSEVTDVNENDFYIQNENVEFFKADGGEEKRTYQQLEILYRARGRELEDMEWKIKKAEDEAAKETRITKHKLALSNGEAEGAQESLRQCQTLLQQTKADLTESQGLVKMLETQVTSLKEAKEELIKKLQVAESTIENLSHQCEELHQSESLSRARNEHEAVVASLTQRYDREMLAVKEKWDEAKTNLASKHDEVVWLKKQLADSTKELERAQISRGETINRLAKSLEDSQRQCQALLEHSSSQEVASLKVKLQQTAASKSISEDMCISLQGDIKELKEQLNMFESASALGAFSTTHVASSHKTVPSLDDSMTDLGIKKTLDFDTPHSTPQIADTSSLEELVSSLRSELERCLCSNRKKRAEIAEKGEEIQSLKQELQLSQGKSQDLERTCANQKARLTDLESLMSNSNGESLMEVRLKRDLEALTKEKSLLLEDVEDYKKRIEEVGASEAKLTEINTELSSQIAQMVSDFDADKAAALDRCQRTLEEVHHMSMESVRTELEGRMASEKNMLVECHRMEMERLRDQLSSAQEEAHSVKSLYIQTCDEMKKQEEETRNQMKEEVEKELAVVWKSKEETKQLASVEEERQKRVCVEENFKKEKDTWDEKREMYEREIKASKGIVAELKSSHEKDVGSFQETISNLKSQHDDEINILKDRLNTSKTKEEQSKLVQMEKEWKSKIEIIENKHKGEKESLEKLLQDERRKVEEKSDLKTGHNVASIHTSLDMKNVHVQTDKKPVEHSTDEGEESLRDRLAQIQIDLQSTKQEHMSLVEKLKSEHRREFEKAARNREEKFQSELRYFLKERDDKSKEKLDLAVKKCEEDSRRELEMRLEEKVLEHKFEMEQLRKGLGGLYSTDTDEPEKLDSNGAGKKLEEKIAKLEEEKFLMEKKIMNLEHEKKEEIFNLMEKYAKEERALTEKYSNEIEMLSQRHEDESRELQERLKELEVPCKDSGGVEEKEEEMTRVVDARVQEERARWFKEAQDYIKKEIDAGLKERQSSESNDDNDKRFEEEVMKKVELELRRLKDKKDEDLEKEIDKRVKEKLDEEVRQKLADDRVEKENDNQKLINSKVKQKLSVEVENLKTKFLSELEARVAKEKTLLEQDVKKWKEEMKKKIDGDKELLVSRMNREVENKVLEEKRKIEEDVMQGKEDDLKEMRKEMEEEMRKRIEKEKREWQKEMEWKESNTEDKETVIRDRLLAAEDACSRAVREKDQAIELVRRREAAHKEEKQKLMAGLKQFRQDLNATKEEHAALESQYAEMDQRYKEDMKEAKRKKELALEELETRANQEKEELIMDYKSRIASMKEDFSNELDKVRSDAEMERAALLMDVRSHTERALNLSPSQEPDVETTTLFELRDHYLETVGKIKEDVMSHVQAANNRAASTLKSEMRKQRRRLVHVFRERCKASIFSILTGQVPSTVLNSLEHAIDIIAEAMVTTPKSTTSGASPSTPRNGSNIPPNKAQDKNLNDNQRADQIDDRRRYQSVSNKPDNAGGTIVRARHPGHSPRDEVRSEGKDCQAVETQWSEPLKNHPQLAKVDLYDSETAGSSPLTSAQSSPASITLRSKSLTHHTNPAVPPLRLSPLQKTDGSPLVSDGQIHHHFSKQYSNEAKPRRPLSAESAKTASQSHKTRSAPRPTSKSKERESIQDQTDESSASPRERMKMIEARVRLANWASSGEMPWKGSNQNSPRDHPGRPEQDETPIPSGVGISDDKLYNNRKIGRSKENENDAEGNVFVKPGKDAENFLKAQRAMKRKDFDLITPSKFKQGMSEQERTKSHHSADSGSFQNKHVPLDGYLTDESNASTESHSSFVTLEPDNHRETNASIPVAKEKDWAMYTSDYDRIKAAVFDRSETGLPNKREEKVVGGFGMSSDDDAISVNSDDVPHFQLLPTSTPARKLVAEQEHSSKSGSKTFSSKHRTKFEGIADNDSENWMTVDAFSGYPRQEDMMAKPLRREHSAERRHPRPSNSKSSQDKKEVAKSVDFEFPDLSEITQASDELPLGRGGMWRYKSLEELLPHQVKKGGKDMGHLKQLVSGSRQDPPVQAMNSDFWMRQSLEDDDGFKMPDQHPRNQDHRPKYSTPAQDQPHKKQSLYSGHSRHHTVAEDSYKSSPLSRNGQSRHLSSKPSSEPRWSQRHPSRNTTNPPSHVSTRRNKTSSTSNPKLKTLPKSSYSPQFDAHVEDLRKSLEEATPFSGKQTSSKSKMKRSVSEQSLHTILWDHEGNPADIDDLVMAYTGGGAAQSHFDLHNFGNDDAF